MKRIYLIAMAIVIAAVVLAAAGCKNNRTMISSIINNPDKFTDREVAIAGTVTKVYAVNLVITEAGAYQIDDGSGKIWVISRAGAPDMGAKVGLKGTVGSGLKFAGETFGTVIREKERRTK